MIDQTSVHALTIHWIAANVLGSVHGNVNADFVDQRCCADGETGLAREFIDFVRIDTLLEHAKNLFKSRCQTSITVETGNILFFKVFFQFFKVF